MTSSPTDILDRTRGRLLLWTGLGLAVLGVVGYVVQFSLKRLVFPWYMPALALLGVVLIAWSVRKRGSMGRKLALMLVGLLAGAEVAVLYEMRLPPYTGPISVGRPFPAFATKRADGTPFTQADLTGERNHALVFFRGRW